MLNNQTKKAGGTARKFSDRALKRLRILARLLMERGLRFSDDATEAIEQVLAAADKQKDIELLRWRVDFIEATEATESMTASDAAHYHWQKLRARMQSEGIYDLIANANKTTSAT